MKSIVFDIEHDGDFDFEVLFSTFIHKEKKKLIEKMIENLLKINQTFSTTKKHVVAINECITRFLEAYFDNSITHYQDDKYTDVWFFRGGEDFDFSFYIYNGNQSFNIYETEDIEIKEIEGGYFIIER